MTYTPGPWKIIYGGFASDEGFSIGSDNAAALRVKVVCECWPCTIVDQVHRDELLANAKLIASVPDLLASCRELIAAMEECGWSVDDAPTQQHREMIVRAIAAVKKATNGH